MCLKCLYAEDIPREHLQEAVNKAYWFVGGGDVPQESVQPAKTIDWEQDESIIFPAVNKAAGFETRTVKYLPLCRLFQGLLANCLSFQQLPEQSLFVLVRKLRHVDRRLSNMLMSDNRCGVLLHLFFKLYLSRRLC